MYRIYVASSWKNQKQQDVVKKLRDHGYKVYDFKKPGGDPNFSWKKTEPGWGERVPDSNFDAMKWADIFVGVGPYDQTASLEMGWASGQGKKTILLLGGGSGSESMVKILDYICVNMSDVFEALYIIRGL